MRKRILCLLLTALLLCGCSASSQAENAATAAETEPAPTEDLYADKSLFLKVSSITFSIVGESEDIYLGMVPRELVTWESADPSIVSVENGVLTAKGVGTTTVRASYNDKRVTITAGCLARNMEEMAALDGRVLASPKRMPPEVDLDQPCPYFDGHAIVGDSITYFLQQLQNRNHYLGNMLFLCRGGVSLFGFVNHFKNLFYKGSEVYLEYAISDSQAKRVYFLLGSNDIQSPPQFESYYANWDTMLDRIREKSPDVEYVIISNIPMYFSFPGPHKYNDQVVEVNAELRKYCAERGYGYFDLWYYIQDHYGRMPDIYHVDEYHLNDAGCLTWMKALRFYAQYELEGGTLS